MFNSKCQIQCDFVPALSVCVCLVDCVIEDGCIGFDDDTDTNVDIGDDAHKDKDKDEDTEDIEDNDKEEEASCKVSAFCASLATDMVYKELSLVLGVIIDLSVIASLCEHVAPRSDIIDEEDTELSREIEPDC